MRKINPVLLIIAILLLTYSLSSYSNYRRQIDEVYTYLITDNNNLQSQLSNCETISNLKDSQLQEIHNYYEPKIHTSNYLLKYTNLKNTKDSLQYLLSYHTSTGSDVIEKFEIRQDILSKEIMFGSKDYSLILCERYELKINAKKTKINWDNNYIIPFEDSIQVEFFKISKNINTTPIDTFVDKRIVAI